jgi:hypothetical protein
MHTDNKTLQDLLDTYEAFRPRFDELVSDIDTALDKAAQHGELSPGLVAAALIVEAGRIVGHLDTRLPRADVLAWLNELLADSSDPRGPRPKLRLVK